MPRYLLFAVSAAVAWSADVRQAAWGMNQAQVLATESGSPTDIRSSAGEVIVTYAARSLGGATTRLIYFFAEDKLVRAKYVFDAAHTNPDDFVADFKAIDPLLREQHGKPVIDRALWEDDDHQTERKAYLDQDRATPADLLLSDAFLGATVAAGNLKLHVQWEDSRTRVLHGLAAVGNLILHQIEYRSVELAVLEERVRRSGGSR